MKLYIPRDEIVILRTNHLKELRTTGNNKVENKRTFGWLSDDTLLTIVHKHVAKFELRHEYVIHCSHNGIPFYILGAFGKFHGKFSFTVISTIKSKTAVFPFKCVDAFHRFNFDTDLSTFDSMFDQDAYDENIEALIAETKRLKIASIAPKDRAAFVMDKLQKRVATRVRLENEEQLKQKQKSDKRHAKKRYAQKGYVGCSPKKKQSKRPRNKSYDEFGYD